MTEMSEPLAAAVGTARAAAARRDWAAAVEAGEQAVELGRQAGDSAEALRSLSVMLFNLASFYSQVERFDDAVRALEEVVALDERIGHEDLESDRQALEQARMMASMSPEERAEMGRQSEELAQLVQNMPPEERAALEVDARRAQIEQMIDAVQQQALAALRGEGDCEPLVEQMRAAAQHASGNEDLGDAREDVAGYFAAVAAVLAGETPSSVPAAYAPQIAALREESP